MPIDFSKDSGLLKAIAHPVRLRMVHGLLRHECHVGRIVMKLALPQSTVSQHLAVLKNRKIITARKEGLKTCYTVSDKRIGRIIAALSA